MREVDLKEFAYSVGFDRIGITTAAPPSEFEAFKDWINKGYAGNLWYLSEKTRLEKRGNLHSVLPGAKSVIVGAISYKPQRPTHSTDAKFARYAWGEDYHDVVKIRLENLARWMKEHSSEPFEYLTYVDTGPILERSLAQRAGLGWIGKNTCVINEKIGSYLFIGEILTTLELKPDSSATNRCGICTRCLDACPTQAIIKPYELDARKCISYQTIENREEEIPSEMVSKLNGWVAGCDICQEVCPWNDEAPSTRMKEFLPLPYTNLTLEDVTKLTPQTFSDFFKKTAFRRIGLSKLVANAKAALSRP